VTLDDVLSMQEAGELIGRTPGAMRKAAQRGTLEARLIGPRYYVTTRDAVALYAARVAVQRPVSRARGHLRFE
jgi:hypothetical protein